MILRSPQHSQASELFKFEDSTSHSWPILFLVQTCRQLFLQEQETHGLLAYALGLGGIGEDS